MLSGFSLWMAETPDSSVLLVFVPPPLFILSLDFSEKSLSQSFVGCHSYGCAGTQLVWEAWGEVIYYGH